MLRTFRLAVSTAALLTAGLALAEDPRPPAGKAPAAEPNYFDVDRFFEEFDRDRDGFLSKGELPERLRHSFDKIDTNKDGKISREELRRGIAYVQPRRRPSDVIFVLIEMSDCDEGCTEEVQRIYDVLRQLDKNKDGKIDPDELAAMRQRIVGERVDSLIKELDADKDGKISRAEARGEIRRNFDELDRNKDGYVDRDELLHGALAKHPPAPDRGKEPAERPR
jgi:Ca2+-binding EF-hand superfamily protein